MLIILAATWTGSIGCPWCFYSNKFPHGLHWEGDGALELDHFPYDEENHPAVVFTRPLEEQDRTKFRADIEATLDG